jgi:predicted N-acetyltransferase YhbS
MESVTEAGARDLDRRATRVAMLEGWATLARYRPQREWQERRGGPELNYVLVLEDQPIEQVLGESEQFFGAGAGYSIIVDVEKCPGVDAGLRRRLWMLGEEEPAMVLGPLPMSEMPPRPAALSIRRVANEADFEAFFEVGGGGRLYVPSLEAALHPDVALLLGAVDGKVVATSRVARVKEDAAQPLTVADINGVATLPEYRRRGYGTAMTWAAVDEGAQRGAGAAVLSASEMGAPVYQRMGFRRTGTYRTYVREK